MIIDKAEYHVPGVENEGNYTKENDIAKAAATHIICFLIWAASRNMIKTDLASKYLTPTLKKEVDPAVLLKEGVDWIDSDDFIDQATVISKVYNRYLLVYGKHTEKQNKGFYIRYTNDIQSIANTMLDILLQEIKSKKWWQFWK